MASSVPFNIARSPLLEGVPHGFFGSSAGAHQFGYGGPGEQEEVREQRATAASAILPGAPIQMPHQVHSPDVFTIHDPFPDQPHGRPVADAVVTARRDVVLGIVTADCGPILFADIKAGVVGAAHAGWRGAHGGVIENTVAAMEELGAKRDRIAAMLGPTIAQASYEVDAAFRENFTPLDEEHFVSAPMREGLERWYFDLPGYILSRLRAAGLTHFSDMALDTYSNPQSYYSYRLATQRGDPNYGRQISAIACP